ncbi:MAG: single-stranded DNA-binding protein [Candidatus Omnitrophica bacterium]|nr:single-stranded DNA-binding protein [Candidatus Omnitrophota bacterium]
MAASLNSVFLIGNLTRDPELRYIPSGQAVTTFTVAVNRNYMAKTGEKKEEVNFIRVVVWAKRAESCHEYLRKGSPVFVEGRLQSRSWDAPDGTKRSTIEVVAQNVQFLGRGSGKQSGSQDVADVPEREEAIIDDSLGSEPKQGSVGVAKDELRPDDEVPF